MTDPQTQAWDRVSNRVRGGRPPLSGPLCRSKTCIASTVSSDRFIVQVDDKYYRFCSRECLADALAQGVL